jgi:hypothetical protein
MRALKRRASWSEDGKVCWFASGMGPMREDGTPVPNGWNHVPAPVVISLVELWKATGDPEALAFAKAYAEGILTGAQPGGVRFGADGSFPTHSHATMHALWGVAELGLAIGEPRYVDFVRRAWEWMRARGTGTGWFPALPDNCNETCCLSDMMSVAAALARAGVPERWDDVERWFRDHVATQQFFVTPDFRAYYRSLHAGRDPAKVEAALAELEKFQGGILGGSGLDELENGLLGGVSGFCMFGCCAPEGMRAIHTAWSGTLEKRGDSIFVNMGLNVSARWGRVVSFMPDEGRMTYVVSEEAAGLEVRMRPPHWAAKGAARAFRGASRIAPEWDGAYALFRDAKAGEELTLTWPLIGFTHEVGGLWRRTAPELVMRFEWKGNLVVDAAPVGGRGEGSRYPAARTRIFSGSPALTPDPPDWI